MTVDLNIQEPRANAQARGHRLKTVRLITGLTRKAMSEKYSISASTIHSWEAAKAGGLTIRGINRLLPMLQQEGVACSADWLLYGIGAPPHLAEASFIRQLAGTALQPRDTTFIQDLCYFRQLHSDGVDLIIADDGMMPHYQRDDVVAGKKRYGEAILTASSIGLK